MKDEKNSAWQVWVQNLDTGKKEKLRESKGVDYRASPNANLFAYTENDDVRILNRKTKKITGNTQ